MKDLPAGHIIGPDDIRRIRPGMGLAPKYFDQVVGQRLSQTVKRGMPVYSRLNHYVKQHL